MSMHLVDVYESGRAAIDFLFSLIKERMTEPEISVSATMPTYDEHCAFVRGKPYAWWYLVMANGEPVGYVSATRRNEIGIVLTKDSRGKGYGPRALTLFMRRHYPLPAVPSERRGEWLANINPANARSIRVFEKLGFKHIQNTYSLEGGQ